MNSDSIYNVKKEFKLYACIQVRGKAKLLTRFMAYFLKKIESNEKSLCVIVLI